MFSGGPYMNCKWSGTCGFANSSMPQPIWRAKFQDFEGTATQVPTGMTYARTGVTWDHTATGVMKQFGAGVLPIGYDPVTHEPIGALVEGGVTNYIPHYDITNTTYWTPTRAAVSNVGAPLDSKGRAMTRLTEDATAGSTHNVSAKAYTAVANTLHCLQFEVKKDTRTSLDVRCADSTLATSVRVKFDLVNRTTAAAAVTGTGAFLASGFVDKANGNVVCWMTCTIDSTSTSFVSYIYLTSAYGTITYDGDGTSGLWVSLPQDAAETTPSSHIDTTGAAAARVRSDLILPLPVQGFSTERGTFVVDFVCPIIPPAGTRVIFDIGTTVSSDVVRCYVSSDGSVNFRVYNGGALAASFAVTAASIGLVGGKRIRVAITWCGTNWGASVGGPSAVVSNTSALTANFPTTTRLLLGQHANTVVNMAQTHFLDAFFLPYAASAQQRAALAKVA